MDLSLNEKRLLKVLEPLKKADPATLAARMETSGESVIQFAMLLEGRGLCRVEKQVDTTYSLTDEGARYAREGLPERQLLQSFGDRIPMSELTRHPLSRIGIGQMRKKGWVAIRDGMVEKTGNDAPGEEELALRDLSRGGAGLGELLKRGLVTDHQETSYLIALTTEGETLVKRGLDLEAEVGTLSREQIITGTWKDLRLRRYSLGTLPKRIYPGKVHPYQRLIGEMRNVLLYMGFTEIYGDIVQSAFWNFDALFQPQDHPAREMQDTFYLKETIQVPPGFERVRDMHLHGGTTSSTGWGGQWSREKAEQCVLRTHTTSLSIQHLAAHPEPPVKAFCINRVYRREAIDPTHLPEFEQLEGIVMDEGVSFRHLLGYLKEFYFRMGFADVRFRPAYFPYTEPSVEPEVFVPGLGWVEMGGAGIFREEVTAPWGIHHPVLAWGLGVSRMAMLRLGLKDLRLLYKSDIEWVKEMPSWQQGLENRGGR
ncbi:MAG: phenylalanine--tRNA ligase subunit alpha [Methanolinea sp.]|jgi:phenylalanyl-tRNA synthetase alpha chain|nr:phenylalanine--tRNA ligase subunit alpha [Methanolinea sp.]